MDGSKMCKKCHVTWCFQLDKLIETTEKDFDGQTLPEDVNQAQMLLNDHEHKKHHAERVSGQ